LAHERESLQGTATKYFLRLPFDLCDGVKKMSAVKIEKSILLLHPKKSIPLLPFQPVFIDNKAEYKKPL